MSFDKKTHLEQYNWCSCLVLFGHFASMALFKNLLNVVIATLSTETEIGYISDVQCGF